MRDFVMFLHCYGFRPSLLRQSTLWYDSNNDVWIESASSNSPHSIIETDRDVQIMAEMNRSVLTVFMNVELCRLILSYLVDRKISFE